MRFASLPLLLLFAPAAGAAQVGPGRAEALTARADSAAAQIRTAALRARTAFLANDLLEGRAPGTRGGRLTERYLATEFQRIGLMPIAGSYLQPVPLVSWTPDPAGGQPVEASAAAAALSFDVPDDVVLWTQRAEPEVDVTGELVFAGYGITAPEWQWDDFDAGDVTGKVLLFLTGEPPPPPTEPDLFEGPALTYYGRWTYKLEQAVRRGAAGALIVHSAAAAGYDWPVVQESWRAARLRPADAPPGLAAAGWVRRDAAARLLGTAGISLDEFVVRAARRDFRPIPTGIQVRLRPRGSIGRFTANNVIGLLPGSDPRLREEVVVYTAHHDHLGTRPGAGGDSIYNGAYDNASGVAVLLAVAETFARLGQWPGRTVLFIATTAEEAGLLGAERYIGNPVRPIENTIAVLNIEGASVWGETDDVTAIGADRSTIGRSVARVAQRLGLEPTPDPAPEAGYFFRGDLFPFARAGVPGVTIQHGLSFRGRPPGFGQELLARYLEQHYHRPSDELRSDMRFDGAAQLARYAFQIGLDLATEPAPPIWLPGGQPVGANEGS